MGTLREYFDTDFNRWMSLVRLLALQSEGSPTLEVTARLHLDFNSNAMFISCYIPAVPHPTAAIVAVLNQLDLIFDLMKSVKVAGGFHGERPTRADQMTFTGRIFFYSESNVPDAERDNLEKEAGAKGHSIYLRDGSYAADKSKLEKPVAFISHDSRDKENMARPIAIALSKLMSPVWFDEFTLKVGDRLRESIERGLQECKKCVLVLSRNFLTNTGWTKVEFNSIFTRELMEQTDFVLPVWAGVTKQQVFDYSPSLADRVAVDWSLGLDEVVRRLHRSLL
jgi:hypothetical protein